MGRRACLAIGVSTVTPLKDQAARFANLDGAVLAARAIGGWALRSGFGADNVRIVDDGSVAGKENPVTRERVQKAVDELFPDRAEVVEQLILAFCGHGLTDANFGSISWLFGDSMRLKYRVIANEFYTELLGYGVQRITLITDACREAPKDLDLMRLDGVRGIAVDGGAQVESPKFDLFAACQDGQLGFMVSEPNSAAPGKCIFSGVIADVLWGVERGAISNGVITTATFGKVVRSRTTERAKDYRLKLNPQCLVDPDAAVLYDDAKPPQGPPDLQPWPPAGAAATMGTAAVAPGDAARNLERVAIDKSFRSRVLGADFGAERFDLAVPSESLKIPGASKDLLQDLVALRTGPTEARRSVGTRAKRQKAEALVHRLEADAVADARQRVAGDVRRSLVQIRPSGGSSGSNLIIAGEVASLWSRDPLQLHKETPARRGFRVNCDPQGTPLLVQFADADFTPHVPYDGLYAIVTKSEAGDVVQAYGEHNSRDTFKDALEAIADFTAGRIGADRIDELAGRLRARKHVDPVLGAICAYLYRAIADFDSIRRMASFYIEFDQPVPFDIALLGAMKVTREAKGALRLQVPAVKARKQRKGEARLPDYVTVGTRGGRARIGGRCPWLGLGWDYVGLTRPEWSALVEGLADHARDIRRSGFTVLPNKVGLALARTWALQSRWSRAES